jgi:hypothetical protein
VVIMAGGRVRRNVAIQQRLLQPAEEVHVAAQGPLDSFVAEIRNAGYHVRDDGGGRLAVFGLPVAAYSQLWEWARATSAILTSLTPGRASLEQMFLDAIQESQGADP